MSRKSFLSLWLALLAMTALASCGSESQNSTASQNVGVEAESTDSIDANTSMIVTSSSIYTVDDFSTAGFKNVTQFDLDTLPQAIDAWYGFFSQKDFELRFYESHQTALDHGVEPAEIAIGKGTAPWSKQPPVRFDAYAVFGNVVMLCELALESCESLIAQFD